jgi:hypothetical protein
MPISLYSIIQVVPNPDRDERLNIGAVVVNEELGYADVSFRPRRRQLTALAPELDTTFLRDFEKSLRDVVHGQGAQLTLGTVNKFGAEDVRKLFVSSTNIIQFTPPAPSTKSPAALLEDVMSRLVASRPVKRPRQYRDKGQLKRQITLQFKHLGAQNLLMKDVVVTGRHAECSFDYGIRTNGEGVGHAVQALSLEPPDRSVSTVVKRDLLAFAFGAEEIEGLVPVSLIAYMGSGKTRLEHEARAITDHLGIELVRSEELPEWAAATVHELGSS